VALLKNLGFEIHPKQTSKCHKIKIHPKQKLKKKNPEIKLEILLKPY
jgi:hypothetical protein